MPHSPGRTTPKAADQAGGTVSPAQSAGRYELLRAAAASGSGGWRHGLGVLLARGMAAWMAAWAAVPPAQAGPGFEPGRIAAATSQAGASLSTSTPSPPAPSTEGGDTSSPACTSLLPTLSPHAISEIVAVLAQMTLAHARPAPLPVQEAVPP